MKKSLVALALFGAFASVAQAQSAVVIYGALDAGFQHISDVANPLTTKRNTIGASDNSKLGFKGVEDLGNGLKALFQLETRFSPDTGTLESNGARPLFQGESRVGLQGNFGTVRIGRGKTAFQDSSAAFEPWSGAGNAGAGFQADVTVAGFNSDPLNGTTSSKNRISNAVFYNSPLVAGFQANVSVGTKEAGTTATVATKVPFSTTVTYNMGIVGAMLAYERNAIEDKVWSVAASVTPMANLKLMASFQRNNVDVPVVATAAVVTPFAAGSVRVDDTKAWLLGANYTMGAGKFLAGYGQIETDGIAQKTKKGSLGYQYSLSKRTYVYADISKKKAAVPVGSALDTSVKYYAAGIHHNF